MESALADEFPENGIVRHLLWGDGKEEAQIIEQASRFKIGIIRFLHTVEQLFNQRLYNSLLVYKGGIEEDIAGALKRKYIPVLAFPHLREALY